MTEEQKNMVIKRRRRGFGYASIAKEVGLTGNMAGKASEGTGSRCKECGAVLVQAEGMKTRVFCSAQCWKKWWKEHPEMLNKKARKIYGLFLHGHSPYKIAKMLTEEGIPTPGGKKVWGKAVVESILTNEKYKGDALLQKVYTVDFLSKKKKVNEGEVPQYYVEGNHPAIIEPYIFDSVQALMKARRLGKNRNSCVGVFSGKRRCSSGR